ncbi:hypothetical protein ACQCRE_14200 [Ralstonia pseudosolanacearum]
MSTLTQLPGRVAAGLSMPEADLACSVPVFCRRRINAPSSLAVLPSAFALGGRPDGMPSILGSGEPFGFDGDALAWAIRSAEMPPNNEINSAALNMFDLNTGISPELNGTSI